MSVVACINTENAEIEPPAARASQGEDDASEEAETIKTSVSQSFFHDVMAGMTRRFEQLLVKQEARQAKLFAELFGDDAVELSGRLGDVTEQTVSLCEEAFTRKSGPDGRIKRRERDAPTHTEAGDSETAVPTAVADDNAPTATQDAMARERCTDGMSELQCGPVNPWKGLKSALQLESCTFAVRHTPIARAVKGVAIDDPGDDISMLMGEMVYRFCGKAGHHYVGCCDRRDRQYRQSKAITYSPRRRSMGIG